MFGLVAMMFLQVQVAGSEQKYAPLPHLKCIAHPLIGGPDVWCPCAWVCPRPQLRPHSPVMRNPTVVRNLCLFRHDPYLDP